MPTPTYVTSVNPFGDECVNWANNDGVPLQRIETSKWLIFDRHPMDTEIGIVAHDERGHLFMDVCRTVPGVSVPSPSEHSIYWEMHRRLIDNMESLSCIGPQKAMCIGIYTPDVPGLYFPFVRFQTQINVCNLPWMCTVGIRVPSYSNTHGLSVFMHVLEDYQKAHPFNSGGSFAEAMRYAARYAYADFPRF